MDEFILRLVEDYNDYSELVQVCYQKKKEGECDDGTLQWNRGQWYCLEKILKEIEDRGLAKLKWDCREHTTRYNDCKKELIYWTVEIISD